MKSKRRTTLPVSRSAFELAAMASLVPFVVTARLMSLAAEPASARSLAEMQRMVREKMAATGEAAVAAGFQMMHDGLSVSRALAEGNVSTLAAAADRTGRRALKPYAKRVRANAKRLASKRGGSR